MTYTHPTRKLNRPTAGPFELYRDMVLYTFRTEIRAGLFIAYYRNFAVPSIAKTLFDRGETTAQPMKRSYDTGIVIHEIITNGFDSERGEKMVELLRRVHKGVPGSTEDFQYVLMTLLVIPLRWIDTHGWRKLTDEERAAAVSFYTELGKRMGLEPAPATFEAAAAFLDDYEARNLAPSPEGTALLDATAEALAVRLPSPIRAWTKNVIALMMDKQEVVPALGLKPAPPWLKNIFGRLLDVYSLAIRTRPIGTEPSFTPGKSGKSVYPHGYQLEDLGPSPH